MGISKTLLMCGLVSFGATVSSATAFAATTGVTNSASDASVLERTDPRLFALISDADATSAPNRVHIERWYETPGAMQPTVVITETSSNTDDAYEITASSQMLQDLLMPQGADDPYTLEAYPGDNGTQLVMRALLDESERDDARSYSRGYERTYERALSNFESNILDIGRQMARVDSIESGLLRFQQSWVSDSFRISRSEPPKHLIAADQIDNEFFSLRMTRWWNADEYALHVDYYLLVRDVEILADDEHRFHDAVVQAQNLLKFTVTDQNEVIIAEADQ